MFKKIYLTTALFIIAAIASYGQTDSDLKRSEWRDNAINSRLEREAKDVFTFGDYRFYCIDYDSEKGGGDYLVPCLSVEEYDAINSFFHMHQEEIQEKYGIVIVSIYVRLNGICRPYIKFYKKDIYEQYLVKWKADFDKRQKERADRIASMSIALQK